MIRTSRKGLFIILILTFCFLPRLLYAEEIDRVLSLVDYIGGDYSNAVRDGEIINEFEYKEMVDFSSAIVNLWEELQEENTDTIDFSEKFGRMKSLVVSRGSVSEVKALADEMKERIIAVYGIRTYPQQTPNYGNGKDVYQARCASCHGFSGMGDGPLAKALNPPATDFTDAEVNSGLSPFKVFNTVTFGIEGTAMASFDALLDEKQKWDVAFYVLSLGHPDSPESVGFSTSEGFDDTKSIESLALLSNSELLEIVDAENPNAALFYLRTGYLKQGISIAPVSEAVLYTTRKLEKAIDLYEMGRKDDAFAEALDGYLQGFQKIEPALVSKNRSLVFEVEKKMGSFRSQIKSDRDSLELHSLKAEIESDLRQAEQVLSGNSLLGGYLSFISSFSIILREALEALLIISAIMASLVHTGNRSMLRYVHMGWILALVAGVATWMLAKTAIDMSGARREIVEGVTSLLAATVLFYVSYWLVSKTDVKKWKEYVRSKTRVAVGKGGGIALLSISFLAVYREAFETMLFYQALFYQTESSVPHVIYGLIAGVVAVSAIAFFMYKFTFRIPLRYFFSFASVFLYLLCFILLGKGIFELQEAGIISTSQVQFLPFIDSLGIYPTYETAIPQFILLVLAVLIFIRNYFSPARAKVSQQTTVGV